MLCLHSIFQFLSEDIPQDVASKVKDYAVEGLNAVYKQRGYVLWHALFNIFISAASLAMAFCSLIYHT